MQSRPIEVSKESSPANPPQLSKSTHHGYRHNERDGSTSSVVEASGSNATTRPSLENDAPKYSDRVGQPPLETTDGDRLNPATPRNRSPVDRIIEHERSLTPSPSRRGQGPDFRVIPRTSKFIAGSKSLNDLPNGVCIILAYPSIFDFSSNTAQRS